MIHLLIFRKLTILWRSYTYLKQSGASFALPSSNLLNKILDLLAGNITGVDRMGKKYKVDRDSDSKFDPDQVAIKEFGISTECC